MKCNQGFVGLIASFGIEWAIIFILAGCIISALMVAWLIGAVVAAIDGMKSFACGE